MLRHGEQVDWSVTHSQAAQPATQRSRQRAASTSYSQTPEPMKMVQTTHQAVDSNSLDPPPTPPKRKRKNSSLGVTEGWPVRKTKGPSSHVYTRYPPVGVYIPPPPMSHVERIGGDHREEEAQEDFDPRPSRLDYVRQQRPQSSGGWESGRPESFLGLSSSVIGGSGDSGARQAVRSASPRPIMGSLSSPSIGRQHNRQQTPAAATVTTTSASGPYVHSSPPSSSTEVQRPHAYNQYEQSQPSPSDIQAFHRREQEAEQSSPRAQRILGQQQTLERQQVFVYQQQPHQPRPSYPIFPPDPEPAPQPTPPPRQQQQKQQQQQQKAVESTKATHKRSQSSPQTNTATRPVLQHTPTMASSSHSYTSHGSHPAEGNLLPPLSLSILGVEPLDEFIKEIADFVHYHIVNRPDIPGALVEVEAKVGLLREPRSGHRIQLPVLVESILQPDSVDLRFESNMSAAQHKHYNQLLNNLKTSSDSPSHPSTPVDYSHLYLVDTFYADNSNDPGMSNGDRRLRGADKIRVTRDEKTNSVVQCVKKIRLADLNIYSPKRPADWRVSVNLEIPCPHPIGSSTHSRKKDRLRYSHEEFMIDLTQVVSQTSPGAPPQTLHELELEVARPELLLATAAKRNDINCTEHERTAFDELIRAFVNNARILVRNSIPFEQPQ